MVASSGLCAFDVYDLSSNDEEYIAAKNLAETTPG